jgi:hypothetical protein
MRIFAKTREKPHLSFARATRSFASLDLNTTVPSACFPRSQDML